MTNTTKENIRETALTLLNTKGLSNVKMRDVSGALHISIGNVTYYYPKWDALIDDIVHGFRMEMEELFAHFPSAPGEVAPYIDRIYAIQTRYAFLFSNLHLFLRLYPQYEPFREQLFLSRMKIMYESIREMIRQGYLYPESEEHDYRLLVKNTWLVLSGWYPFSAMFAGTEYVITKKDFFRLLWNIFVYHLTEEGKKVALRSFESLRA